MSTSREGSSVVLVTGAASFVGSAVVHALRKSGCLVLANVRQRTSAVSVLAHDPGVRVLVGDLANGDSLARHDLRADAIVHAAATSLLDERGPVGLLRDNVSACETVASLAQRLECPVLIGLSSVSVYGLVTDGRVSATTSVHRPSLYGLTKFLGEAALMQAASAGVSVCVLRLPGVVGRGAHRIWMSRVLGALQNNQLVPVYSGSYPFNNAIHRDDLANFVVSMCMSTPSASGMFPLGSAEPEPLHDLLRAMAEESGSTSVLVDSNEGPPPFWIDDSAAREALGYSPPPIREVLMRYVRDSKQGQSLGA